MITISQINDLQDKPVLRIRFDKKNKEIIYEVYVKELKGFVQFNKYIYNQELNRYMKNLKEYIESEYNLFEPVLTA